MRARALALVFAFARGAVSMESAHAEIRAERMEVAALIVRSAQVSSFNICCARVEKKKASCVEAAAPHERGEESARSGTSD